MKKLKKNLAVILVVFLILGSLNPLFVLAEEPEVTSAEIENQAGVISEVDSTAISGENTIAEPEISPTPTPEAAPATVETGDSLSVVEVENSVNSTEVNSQVSEQTLNVFESGDIDLTAVSQEVSETEDLNNSEVNTSMLTSENSAYVENNIVSSSNTGQNVIEGAGEALINTGDAYSAVSVLNQVNTTVVDSTVQIVIINIFGNVEGNIILPESSSQTEGACCGQAIQTESQALVKNSIDSAAISGQNTIISTESASINTGSAQSAVNLVNIVNTSLIGVTFYYLSVNTFGTWEGNFLGWDNFGVFPGGGNLTFNSIEPAGSSCPSCVGDVLLKNQAWVVNNISSMANTGGNFVNGGKATINTGNAYSIVSIVNFVNTSIINSFGFFGFINIFGVLKGDIGGASFFASSEPEAQPESEVENTSSPEPGPFIREEGGLLEVSLEDNVGTHVLPGDTITFFVKVKNSGTARVYDTHLRIGLVRDGMDMGGGTFNLGDIEPKKGVKVTTGLVLSKEAKPGDYTARAIAWGLVGPGDSEISASADSFFLIAGISRLVSGITEEVQAAGPGGETLGAMATNKGLTKEQRLGLLLIFSLGVYLAIILSRRRALPTLRLASLRSLMVRLSSFLTSFLS